MDFVPENCFNLRHHKIVTLSSGRRPALNTSCSLATRAAVSGDVNFPCYVVWRERRRLGLVVLLFSHGEAVADHVCRSTSGACARTFMFWSETSSALSLSSAALSRRPAASLGSAVCLANRRSVAACLRKSLSLGTVNIPGYAGKYVQS